MRTLLVALQGLRGTPARSILVVLALTLGMLGFVAVLTANQVMRDTVSQRAILQGGLPTTVEITVTGPQTESEVATVREQLESRLAAGASATTLEDPDVTVWSGNTVIDNLAVTFTTPSLRGIRPFPQVSGTWLKPTSALAPRVVVNEAAAAALQDATDRELGTTDTRTPFVVIGTVRDGNNDPHMYAEAGDYSHFDTTAKSWNILLHAPDLTLEDANSNAKQLSALTGSFTLTAAARSDRVGELSGELDSTTRVLFVLGSLGLASTIVGILNVGLATASTRSKEFTLRRALGGSRAQIAAIVILESQLLAITAAAIALAGSYILFPVVTGAFGTQLGIAPPPYDSRYGIVCLIVASAAALISSLVPAALSYRRDLSRVMRE